jgi:hypothetical protein
MHLLDVVQHSQEQRAQGFGKGCTKSPCDRGSWLVLDLPISTGEGAAVAAGCCSRHNLLLQITRYLWCHRTIGVDDYLTV